MKKLGLVLVILVMTIGMVFAGGSSDSDGMKMGFLIRNLNETFVRDYADNLEKNAEAAGIDYTLLDGNGDVATQLDQLNTLLSQGYKYFVIIPQDSNATEQMAEAIERVGGSAAFSNIAPTVDALKVGPTFYFASSPETIAGNIQADILANYFDENPSKAPGKEVNVLYLNGQLGHPAQIARRNGFVAGMAANGYTLNFVAEDTANWGAAEAQQKVDAWQAAFDGEFNAVIGQNDDMALGAIESLLSKQYVDDPSDITRDVDGDGTVLRVPVIGIDKTATGYASVQKNQMLATVLQDSVGQSDTAFELVYATAMNDGMLPSGFTTKAGIGPATETQNEPPLQDAAVLPQCFVVPFAPVTE